MAADPSRNLKLEENWGDQIPRHVGTLSRRVYMEGYLLKRSETLRRWNQRWFSLDPTTAKMEYRTQRDELQPRGYIVFDVDSTVTVSPINFHGAKEYDGCSFYIGTPRKKEYYLCAETPAAARAWVATIRAACVVLGAHKEAVNSLTDSGRTQMAGAVKAAAASACAIAQSHAKDIAIANQKAVMNPHQQGSRLHTNAALMKMASESNEPPRAPAPTVESDQEKIAVMKETLRVKDEELQHLLAELRSRDATIRDMAMRLSQTAGAAEAAAAAAHDIDRNRSAAVAKIAEICKQAEEKLEAAARQVKAASEREAAALAERDQALSEAAMWRSKTELAHNDIRRLLAEADLRSGNNLHTSEPEQQPHLEPNPKASVATAMGDQTTTNGTGATAEANRSNEVLQQQQQQPVEEDSVGNEPESSDTSPPSGNGPAPLPVAGPGNSEVSGATPCVELPLEVSGRDMDETVPLSDAEADDLSIEGHSPGAQPKSPPAPFQLQETEDGGDSLEGLDLDVDFLQPALAQLKAGGVGAAGER